MLGDKKFLSGLILRHMEENHLTQKEMAAKLDVRPSALCGWLNPVGHGITRKHAERIKFVCREQLSEILGQTGGADAGSDLFLRIVLEAWRGLDAMERAQVAGLAQKLADAHRNDPAEGRGPLR